MWKLAFVVVLAVGAARPAHAGPGDVTFTVTAGTGWRASSPDGRIPTDLMLAPGIEILGKSLRLDVGFVADFPDIDGSRFDIAVRPSLVAELPLLPIYGRLTSGVTRLVHGPIAIAFGPSIGVREEVGTVSVLGEVGYVPIIRSGHLENVLEARGGVGFGI
jgi:hypothetical protein